MPVPGSNKLFRKKDMDMNYEDEFDSFQVSSVTDYTGLMPTPPQDEAEWESYKDLYDFEGAIPEEEEEMDY